MPDTSLLPKPTKKRRRFTRGPWFAIWNFEPDSKGRSDVGYTCIYDTPNMQGRRIATGHASASVEEQISNVVLLAAAPRLLAFVARAILAARRGKVLTPAEVAEGLQLVTDALQYETAERYLRTYTDDEKKETDHATHED